MNKSGQHIKFSQPSVEDLYPRQRLLQMLSSACEQGQSVWIGAPPGAGKTSLAASYAAIHPGRVIWFRIEAADAEIPTFVRNLFLAVGKKPPTVDPFAESLSSVQDALKDVMQRQPANTLWIWDSCELLPPDSDQFQALVEHLKHLPHGQSMIFNSREAPPPGFRALQVARRLEVLSWEALRLDSDETSAIARRIARQPTTGVEQWQTLSEGWVAALVLLVQSSERPQSSSREWKLEFFDYLAEEMLQRMDQAQQHRLMQLSVLPCIPVKVARDLLDDPEVESHLQQMVNQWHLMEVSEKPSIVYRLHPLLKHFMQEQLVKRLNRDELDALYRRGADSLEAFGLLEASCGLRTEAEDWQGLLRQALELAESLSQSGRFNTLQSWLLQIPDEIAAGNPWHRYWLGVCLRFEEPVRGWPLLEAAFEEFRSRGEVVGQYSAWLAMSEAMLVVFEDLKPLKRWLKVYDNLRERHPRCPDMQLRLKSLAMAGSVMSVVAPRHPRLKRLIRLAEIGSRLIPFKTPRQAAFTYLILHYANTGQIARMQAMARQLLPGLEDEGLPAPMRLFAHAMIGLHQIIAGDESPEKILSAAVSLSNSIGGGMFSTIPRSYLIYYEIISGRLTEAQKSLAELKQITPPNHRMYQAAHDFMDAWVEIANGDRAKGLQLSQLSKAMCSELEFDFGLALNTSLRVQAMVLENDLSAAQAELEELNSLAESSGSSLLAVMHGLVEAWLILHKDSEETARQRLSATLDLAEREGILAYPGMLRQVSAELALVALRGNLSRSFVERLVRRWRLQPDSLSPLETEWPWRLRATTLGRFRITLDEGEPLGFEQSANRRPLELLACLIALGGRNVPKSRLSDRLWPDTDADKANHALDNLLYRLRKLVGSDCLQVDASLISLNPALCWVDSWVLESLAEDNDNHNLSAGQATELLLEIYQDDFLLGEEQSWLVLERDRLRSRFTLLAESLGCQLVSAGDDARALALWDRALSRNPLAENLYLRMMQCYAEKGRQTEALAVYRRCQRSLSQSLGIEPGEAIRAYAQSLGNL